MKRLLAALMYTATLTGANLASADMSEIAALRSGDMQKLNFHSSPKAASDTAYIREDGTEGRLSDHAGKIVVLNFWATWCAPCRKEMPMFSELQRALGGTDLEVVTVATGRNTMPAMKAFFADIDVDNLPLNRDPRQKLARDMGVLGLPITVILDRSGQEIARLRGDADWASQSAKDILTALVSGN